MYLDYVVDIPDVKGKITFRTKGQAGYVYYEYSREYDPSKQYTNCLLYTSPSPRD